MPLPEKKLIAQLRSLAESPRGGRSSGRTLLQGIGDDCAVLRPLPGHDTLVTTDFSLEGIHFRRDWHSPESVGHRCLTRGLSDIAAMGGKPLAAFLSLALPRDLPQTWVGRFGRSLVSLADTHGIQLAGGDTAESPTGIFADIVVLGAVPKRTAVLRSGARAGDRIYVSGELGGSAAAVFQMQAKPKHKLNPRHYSRHFFPEPRVELGRILRERHLVTAMIDLSDGLSTDLAHVCEESGVGAEVRAKATPRALVGKPAVEVELDLALHGGEDYELLFTVRAGKRIPAQIAGVQLTEIGVITRQKKICIIDSHANQRPLHARGWEHFRR